ncbi:hypothetical protein [Streptomyces vinaceus]
MPIYHMTLRVHTEAATPTEAAEEFLAATEEASISFDIIETVDAESTP